MRLIRKLEEHYDTTLILEFKSDHSGCIKDHVLFNHVVEWNSLEEFNELIKEWCYVRPNRSSR
jgi:hypothetical protein